MNFGPFTSPPDSFAIMNRALESGAGKWWHERDGEESAFSVEAYARAQQGLVQPTPRAAYIRTVGILAGHHQANDDTTTNDGREQTDTEENKDE